MRYTKSIFLTLSAIGLALTAGCSSNMVSKGVGGAAAGAVSGSMLGAVTDLIVDGEVNTYRLKRNMVSGAIAGGTAGAAVGHKQDKAEEAAKAPPKAPAGSASDKELIEKIGEDNYRALEHLVHYQYEEAYRSALKASESKNSVHRDTGLAMQALIDLDRGNRDGMNDSIDAFLEVSDTVADRDAAEKGLNELQKELKQERKIQGIRPPKA